ncbi:hypothetical protein GF312_03710 [Candidatus Poribacteria bacterium]|nr:hypothetical protein [Candidatus Poribacteria bacterium]
MNNPCQPSDEWVDFYSLKRCQDYVFKMQRRLDKAVRDNNIYRIRHITHLLSRRSSAVKILAIEGITRIKFNILNMFGETFSSSERNMPCM